MLCVAENEKKKRKLNVSGVVRDVIASGTRGQKTGWCGLATGGWSGKRDSLCCFREQCLE